MPLDEWQEQALEASMGERADGKWASKFVGISAPRQNGKSQLIVARALAGILLFDEKMIIISAHETDTAREIWKRLIDVVEDNPSLEGRITGRMDAINREFLAFGKGADKQTIKLKARRSSGARGFSADCLLLDEAQILGKQSWGSIVPTMSARPNPQLWLFGTPPTETDDPFAFARVRESSAAKKARHCWLEWAANPSDNYDDPETWAKANPAYGVRISYEACADDRSAMDDDQFARERLGIWDSANRVSLFEEGSWESARRDERPEGLTVNALAMAVSIDLAHSAIVAGSEGVDGDVWVRPLHHGPGTKGVVERCVELQAAFGVDVVVDGRGPGAVLIPHLEKAGVRLHIATTGDVLDAFANLETKIRDGQFFHVSAPELDAAAAGAVRRPVGDRSALGRKKSEADISPLEAASLAAWRAGLAPVKKRSKYEDEDLLTI
jgi:phage terminase large subunit-like protein